ncbi:reverse transcriptase domain-containing protein [Tanacetum coccineum]
MTNSTPVKGTLDLWRRVGIKIRKPGESHYTESKTPTCPNKPRKRHEAGNPEVLSPLRQVFKMLKKYRISLHSRLPATKRKPWTCEERNPFTPRIRHFSLPRTRMPSHVKTYDESGDPEEVTLKIYFNRARQKQKVVAMPTWCPHVQTSTLTGNARVWFDKLPKESIDSYEDLRTAFRENYLQ